MNSHQLQSFLTAVEQGSFSKAAKKLYVSVPSFSQQIKTLEKELGLALFERSKNGVKLTEGGKIMHEAFVKIAAVFGEAHAEALSLETEKQETLVIACDSVGRPPAFQTDVIALFHQSMPFVSIEFTFVPYKELFDGIRKRSIDLCFFTPPDENTDGDLCFRPAYEEQILCCIAPSDPLARKSAIDACDLIDRVICVEEFARNEAQMAPFFDSCDLKFNFEPYNIAQLMSLESSKSVILMPESYRSCCCPPLIGIPLNWKKIQHGITYHAKPTPLVKKFVEIAADYFVKNEPTVQH